ncbi:MAG TPA: AAA family ATPase [Bacteroidia bacterium]
MSSTAQGNPFAGMTGVKSEDLSSTERLKIGIVGKPKSGKSTLATTARTPMLYYDHDDRPESLAGKSGLFVKSKPSMLDVETDLSIMKANKIKKLPLPETIVHDSVTFMNRAMEDEIFRQGGKDFYREIKVGNSTTVKVRKGWDTINGIQRYINYLIAEYSSLGVDIIFVFHEKNEKDYAESTKEEAAYTGQLVTDPQYLNTCLSLFNEVYHIKVNEVQKYICECRPNSSGNWNTTLELDPIEMPNILDMIKKHETKRAAMKGAVKNG